METSTQTLNIQGALNIISCKEIGDAFNKLIIQKGRVCINLAGVEKSDAAGIQFLCLARQSANANSFDLEIVNPSSPVIEMAKCLGVSEDEFLK